MVGVEVGVEVVVEVVVGVVVGVEVGVEVEVEVEVGVGVEVVLNNMQDLVTIDTIINWLKEQVENKYPVDPHTWLGAAQKLTVLLEDEHDQLYELEQKVAQKRVKLLEEGFNATSTKMRVEASDEYKEARKLKARIGRIEEMCRLAKVQARMRDTVIGLQ